MSSGGWADYLRMIVLIQRIGVDGSLEIKSELMLFDRV